MLYKCALPCVACGSMQREKRTICLGKVTVILFQEVVTMISEVIECRGIHIQIITFNHVKEGLYNFSLKLQSSSSDYLKSGGGSLSTLLTWISSLLYHFLYLQIERNPGHAEESTQNT